MAGSYGIILLAAGASLRLGRAKQLLLYNGKTLLQHGAQVAIGTGAKPIIIVLGAGADRLVQELNQTGVQVVINQQWSEGMASSIHCGLQKLLEIAPGTTAVIFMVCDQPFVTTELLQNLAEKYQRTGKPIIASSYENIMGTPALFDSTIFASLMELRGEAGAKKIITENPHRVDIVNFPLGNIDIDTNSDYEKLLSRPL